MRIESAFEIGRPADQSFAFLVDLDRVAPCLPGATLGEPRAGGPRDVTVVVRLGPMRLTYEGEVSITEEDPATRRAVLEGSAREVRGGGRGEAVIEMTVTDNGPGSRVAAVADITLTGRAAQMGQGLVDELARQMIDEMARCIESRLASEGLAEAEAAGSSPSSPAPAEAVATGAEIRAGALVWRALVSKFKALFRRR